MGFCMKHNIVFNGYSPYSGPGGAGKMLSNPVLKQIAGAHNVSTAEVILNWHLRLGIPFNPETQNPAHQRDILEASSFKLTDDEVARLNVLNIRDPEEIQV